MSQETFLCVVCGKEFEPYREHQKYCSKQCRNRADKNDRRFSGIREYVLDRDGYACVQCGSTRQLAVHHKDCKKFNNSPDNLVTLCRSCHAKIHSLDIGHVRPETRKCVVCGGEYHPVHESQKLCRRKTCKREWKKLQKRSQHESAKCAVCGKVFVQKHSNHNTCSTECRHEYDKRKKMERYYADRDAQLERQRSYYERNKERIKAYVSEWRKSNPDKVAQYYENSKH